MCTQQLVHVYWNDAGEMQTVLKRSWWFGAICAILCCSPEAALAIALSCKLILLGARAPCYPVSFPNPDYMLVKQGAEICFIRSLSSFMYDEDSLVVLCITCFWLELRMVETQTLRDGIFKGTTYLMAILLSIVLIGYLMCSWLLSNYSHDTSVSTFIPHVLVYPFVIFAMKWYVQHVHSMILHAIFIAMSQIGLVSLETK